MRTNKDLTNEGLHIVSLVKAISHTRFHNKLLPKSMRKNIRLSV